MQDVKVVVVFQSRHGATERLALAAAVGAVQGRAFIRLRWLQDEAPDASAEDSGHRARMSREYVAPRESDAEWAEAILVGMPEKDTAISPEFQKYFDCLAELQGRGKLAAKIGAAFTPNGVPLTEAFVRLGMKAVEFRNEPDGREAARAQGRRVADAIRTFGALPTRAD
jgi:multimeric flavodoxin WrbA